MDVIFDAFILIKLLVPRLHFSVKYSNMAYVKESFVLERSMSFVLLIILVLLVLYIITIYNKIIVLKNYVKEAFSTMDVYLKKRWDIIPNLIECVKEYAEYEKEVLTEITELRAKNYSAMSNNEKFDVNKQISTVMPKIFAVAENYPDIKSNQNYINLAENLTMIENDIANSRKYYNGTVRELNTILEIFPSNIVGNIFKIQKEKLFEINEEERQNVKVDF